MKSVTARCRSLQLALTLTVHIGEAGSLAVYAQVLKKSKKYVTLGLTALGVVSSDREIQERISYIRTRGWKLLVIIQWNQAVWFN